MLVIPEEFRYKMLMVIFGNFVANFLFELVVVKWLARVDQRCVERKKTKIIMKNATEARKLLLEYKPSQVKYPN